MPDGPTLKSAAKLAKPNSVCARRAIGAALGRLNFGYRLMVFVGHTPAQYANAQRAAGNWEERRHVGLGPQTIAAVAVDESAGVAKQIRWVGPDNAVALVDIH